MGQDASDGGAIQLTPTQYHQDLLAYFKDNEAGVWAWANSTPAQDEHTQSMRDDLLKTAYRFDPTTHGAVHDLCRQAMERLGLDAPVSLYQRGAPVMNAALHFIPGEIHVVFYGDILERLEPEEQLALLGHELAHYKLWSDADGAYHAVERILGHTLTYPEATNSHAQSTRLFQLHTELYADRGAALVSGGDSLPIQLLIKMMTGLSEVDVQTYLDQIKEIQPSETGSEGHSHPEIFLRAEAIKRWWQGEEGVDAWVDTKLRGKTSLGGLDLLQQVELTRQSVGLLQDLKGRLESDTDLINGVVQRFEDALKDIKGAPEPTWTPDAERSDDVRDYFFALIFDLAMVDRDMRDHALEMGAQVAVAMKALPAYQAAMKRDLKLRKPTITRLTRAAEAGA